MRAKSSVKEFVISGHGHCSHHHLHLAGFEFAPDFPLSLFLQGAFYHPFQMIRAADPLPHWLEENCQRLKGVSTGPSALLSDEDIMEEAAHSTEEVISHLNMNIRRLDLRMMEALVDALGHNSHVRVINLTTSLTGNPKNHSNEILLPLAKLLMAKEGQPTLSLLEHSEHSSASSLQVIYLSYNHLTNAVALGPILATNPCLQELYLDHNRLDERTAIALAQGLTFTTPLSSPKSSKYCPLRAPDIVQFSGLRVLCLNSNLIGDRGGEAIGRMLQTNRSLRSIRMSNNRLGSRTAIALWRALQSNVTLCDLQLDGNPDLCLLPDCPSKSYPYVKFSVRDQLATTSRFETLVQANKAGRYLLKAYNEAFDTRCLWPRVLVNLDPDPLFYFVKELSSTILLS